LRRADEREQFHLFGEFDCDFVAFGFDGIGPLPVYTIFVTGMLNVPAQIVAQPPMPRETDTSRPKIDSRQLEIMDKPQCGSSASRYQGPLGISSNS
jgi:hypothetical protein